MAERKIAKVFQNGGSQAVRLPAEFRFDADEVLIWRDEQTGNVVLAPDERQYRLAELLAHFAEHPIPDEEWEPFDTALKEIRTMGAVYDEAELKKLFEPDE